MNIEAKKEQSGVSVLMQLESMVRRAESLKALQFIIVNETRKLIPYRQAFLLETDSKSKDMHTLQCASSIAVIEKDAHLTSWIEKLVSSLYKENSSSSIQQIDITRCPERYKERWKEFSLPFVLWCPLDLANGRHMGVFWLSRETPWQENEIVLIKRLAETFAHAWFALSDQEKLQKNKHYERVILGSVFFIVASFFVIPVRISALAPVEVVARDPTIISAPMDGVIKEVLVPPNTFVVPGMQLLKYEDTDLRNKYEISEKSMAVAMAEFRQASQSAFQDTRSSSQVSALKAQVEYRQAERDYSMELFQQVDVISPVSGLLIYSDESNWTGQPVRVGEQIMQVADPDKIELRINIPVNDAIVLAIGAEIKIFLDYDPLNSLAAVLRYASYEAELTPEDILAYRIIADLDSSEDEPRIGLQGTAKIYGERMSLFFYLFRRPIATMRQYIGI
ncbi:MAG: multidrug resistance efflux pump [Gammaproteobacteria bacterium]